jgi:hypothetical protein
MASRIQRRRPNQALSAPRPFAPRVPCDRLLGRLAPRSETVVPESPDWRRSALTPIFENFVVPSILQKPRSKRERRAAVAAAVTAILENIATPKEAEAGNATTGERPSIGSSGVVSTPPSVVAVDDELAESATPCRGRKRHAWLRKRDAWLRRIARWRAKGQPSNN